MLPPVSYCVHFFPHLSKTLIAGEPRCLFEKTTIHVSKDAAARLAEHLMEKETRDEQYNYLIHHLAFALRDF